MANNNKKGLGRGLSSLLGGDDYESTAENPTKEEKSSNNQNINYDFDGEVKIRSVETKEKNADWDEKTSKSTSKNNTLKVDIEEIHANPNQPRTKFSQVELEQLSESIKRHGLLQPILVNKKDDGYEVIAGERRLRACKLAGIQKVPIIIKEVNDNSKLELALIENIQREDLNPMEEAITYKKILDTQGISHSELAEIVSKARSTITNSLRLLDLPEKAQQLLKDNKISAGHARAILSVSSSMGKEKLLDKIVENQLNVREAESYANLYNGQNTKALKTVRPQAPKSYKKAAKVLKEHFGRPVKVRKTSDKNLIQIQFNDEKDLERILGLMLENQ